MNYTNYIFKLKKSISDYIGLKVVSLRRTFYLIGIIILVMLFDALSIISIMPLIQFIQAKQDINTFIDATSYGQYLVNFYDYLYIPFTLLNLSILFLFLVSIRQFFNIFEILETQRTTLTIAKDLSVKLFQSVMSSKASYIRSLKQGQFTVLCENECNRTSLLYKTFLQFISASLQISAYAVVMFYNAPIMTLIAISTIVLLIISMFTFFKRSHNTGEELVNLRKNFYNFINEKFSLWRLFKFGASIKNEIFKIENLADKYANKQLDIIKFSSISRLIIAVLAMLFCVLFLNLSVSYFSYDIGKITLFAIIFIRLIPLGQKLNSLIMSIVSYIPSLSVIRNALKEADKNLEELNIGENFLEVKNMTIEFKDINFSYSEGKENIVLENINLKIPENKITAIIGKSGAGKSTLIDLLPRIINPNSGTILIGGKNLESFNLLSLRKNISLISQDTILFDGSIKENISYYNNLASDNDILEASILSGADEFIQKLPNKYSYKLSEKGQNLSGGQKQRLMLARAFLTKSKILILDEATSALDHSSELQVKKSIKKFIKINNSTIIIIAHNRSTIENADHVIFLDAGKVKEHGEPNHIFEKYYKN